jgi:hypothetical protein
LESRKDRTDHNIFTTKDKGNCPQEKENLLGQSTHQATMTRLLPSSDDSNNFSGTP